MTIQRRTKRRIIETEELVIGTPATLADLEDAIAQARKGMTGADGDKIVVTASGPGWHNPIILTREIEVPVEDGSAPLRDDDPVPPEAREGARSTMDVNLPDPTRVDGGTGAPPLKNGDSVTLTSTVTYDDGRVVPPFPTTPETGKDVELTQAMAFQILDHPGTWYFRLEGKNVKEEDKHKTRYRLRLNRAKNKHVHGDRILIETKKHRNPQALEVTIVR